MSDEMIPLSDVLAGLGDRFRALAKQAPPRPPEPPAAPVCEACKGAGWVYGPRQPWELVRPTVRCPVCGPRREIERLARAWPVPPALDELAGKKIHLPALPADDDPAYPAMRQAREAVFHAIAVVKRYMHEWPGVALVIDGNYGVAKTHLLAWIRGAALGSGRAAIYATAPAIERALTNFEHEDDLTPRQAYRDLVGIDVLLIDEAGRYKHGAGDGEDGNAHFERQYLDLVSERLMHNRPTVLAGNHLRRQLHPAIVSRASEGAWVDLTGVPDMRPSFGRKWEGGE